MLTGKYNGGQRPAGARFTLFSQYQERYCTAAVREAAQKYSDLAFSFGTASISCVAVY